MALLCCFLISSWGKLEWKELYLTKLMRNREWGQREERKAIGLNESFYSELCGFRSLLSGWQHNSVAFLHTLNTHIDRKLDGMCLKEHHDRKDLHMLNRGGSHGKNVDLFVYAKAHELTSLMLCIFIGLFVNEKSQKRFTKNLRHSFNMKRIQTIILIVIIVAQSEINETKENNQWYSWMMLHP